MNGTPMDKCCSGVSTDSTRRKGSGSLGIAMVRKREGFNLSMDSGLEIGFNLIPMVEKNPKGNFRMGRSMGSGFDIGQMDKLRKGALMS